MPRTNHPTAHVGTRVDLETLARMEELISVTGMSLADLIKQMIDYALPRIQLREVVRKEIGFKET